MIPKFRAWSNYSKTIHEVWEIDFPTEEVLLSDDWDGAGADFRDVVLMQSTGLKDKNGAEVYFNDIVEDEYGHRYEVVFEGDCLRCNGVRKIRGGHKPKNRGFGRGLKIIGNIYENPELLEVTE